MGQQTQPLERLRARPRARGVENGPRSARGRGTKQACRRGKREGEEFLRRWRWRAAGILEGWRARLARGRIDRLLKVADIHLPVTIHIGLPIWRTLGENGRANTLHVANINVLRPCGARQARGHAQRERQRGTDHTAQSRHPAHPLCAQHSTPKPLCQLDFPLERAPLAPPSRGLLARRNFCPPAHFPIDKFPSIRYGLDNTGQEQRPPWRDSSDISPSPSPC